MSDPFDDYNDDDYVASDFHMIVGEAQYNELVKVERQREREREAARALRKANEMTLMQIAGLKSQREIDKEDSTKDVAEQQRLQLETVKRKEIENAKLRDQFPHPNITDT
jgi:cell division protein FtsB